MDGRALLVTIVFAMFLSLLTPVKAVGFSSDYMYQLCIGINMSNIYCRLQWSSGSMLACSARSPRIEPMRQTSFSVLHENHSDTQLWARAAHLLQCLGRLSLPPSEGR